MGVNVNSTESNSALNNTINGLSDEDWNNVHTPQGIAELCGYELSIKNGNYIFRDELHDLDIYIDKSMFIGQGRHFIDMESTGKQIPDNTINKKFKDIERKDLRDVIRSIYELSGIKKDAIPLIAFVHNNEIFKKFLTDPSQAYLGGHVYSKNKADWKNDGHFILMYSTAFNTHGNSIRKILEHEGAHAIDWMMGSKDKKHGLSTDKEFRKHIGKIGNISKNSNRPNYQKNSEKRFSENWADAESVYELAKKGLFNEKIRIASGEQITVKQWINKYKDVYTYIGSQMDALSSFSFKKSNKYNKVSNQFIKNYGVEY